MGSCLSKKQGSSSTSTTTPVSASNPPSKLKNPENGVTVTLPKPTNPELNLKRENKFTVQEKQLQQDQVAPPPQQEAAETQVKKEIFIIKHRKSHDENREKHSKIQPFSPQRNVPAHTDDGSPSDSAESMGNKSNSNKIAPSTPNIGVSGVRASSCTKEEVDAILIQCGRLSRSSSGRAATSSSGIERGRKYSGSKRSFDFDHCENDAISGDGNQKRATENNNSDEYDGVAAAENGGRRSGHQHRQRHRQSPRPSSPSSSSQRRRTPSRERDQRSSSRERRVSRSPGRRSSETTTNPSANGSNPNANNSSNNVTVSRPGKMVSVPATVTSLVMDKSNNGGGEYAAGVKRITVKRNVGDGGGVVGSRGSASPRSQSPTRGNGNAANGKDQQQPSLSRNNSARKAEHSPYRRNPLSEIDPNSLSYPQSNANNGSSKAQNRTKKDGEAETNQKPYALEKGVNMNCKTKEQQQEEDTKDINNVVVKTMMPPPPSSSSIIDNNNMKPQSLTRSRSSRRSRDLDINPESLLNTNNPPITQSYTSLLLEDIQNFHQKNTQQQPSISLPACLSKACSILEAVADLNSTTSSNNNASIGANINSNSHYGKKRVIDPFVESEVLVSDDVMEPSLHKYVTVKRGGSVCGVIDTEDQESSGSNSFTVSSGQQMQQYWGGISNSLWEPNSADSTDDCSWTSRLMVNEGCNNNVDVRNKKNGMGCKRRECDDHQHSGGIGRGRIGVAATAASTL